MPAPYNLPANSSVNITEGLDQLLVYTAQEIPSFIPSVLLALFVIIWLGGVFAQQRRQGDTRSSQWFLIAGFLTTIAALLMSLIDGLIAIQTVIIVMSVTFVGAIWYFWSGAK